MTFWGSSLTRIIAGISGRIGGWRENRARTATMRSLETLHPSVLRDMGITRSEAMSVSFGNQGGRRRSHG
ncbi:DUF1127 domain-containing protein [Rhodobacteraceae bacterium NNCM2]|nr:DUF1127 domain-containing protein [Coraliihabitans acroporae]